MNDLVRFLYFYAHFILLLFIYIFTSTCVCVLMCTVVTGFVCVRVHVKCE